MLITVMGLVIAERSCGENDKFIEILTAEYGVIEICVKGAKKITGKSNAAAQMFVYAKFCFNKHNDRYYLNSCETERLFYGLRTDLLKLTLAEYFSEITRYCISEGQPAKEITRLFLNSLHFLSEGLIDRRLLKSIFELRFLSEIGFMPQLIGCRECYKYETDEMYFLVDRCNLLCGKHLVSKGLEENYYHIRITKSVLQAMRHICLADMKRIFNFRLGKESTKLLNEITEKYIISRLKTNFRTLKFYKELCNEDDYEKDEDDQ